MEKKTLLRWGGTVVLLLLLCGAFTFLRTFTRAESSADWVEWQSAAILSPDGTEQPLDLGAFYETPPRLAPGEVFVFRAALDQVGAYEDLVLDLSGGETVLLLNGTVLLDTESSLPAGTAGLTQVRIPPPPDLAGGTLELRCRPAEGEALSIFPPLLRLHSVFAQEAEAIAYGSLYAIPAGAMTVVFLLVCFFIGLLWDAPDRTLPVLALATAILAVIPLSQGLGYSFLPEKVFAVLSWPGFAYLAPALLLAYLALNRKRTFWRRLGRCTLATGAVLGAAWLLSLARDGYLASYLESLLEEVRVGYFRNLLYWLTVYLAAACAAITAFTVTEGAAKLRAEASALAIRADLMAKNFQNIQAHDREVAALRHELNHHITAMRTMYQAGKTGEVGQYLEELGRQDAALPQVRFTDNITINAILQDAAARASREGIRFEAQAPIPAELSIPEGDLCSLLMNLLDNALEAAAKTPEAPFIRFHCQLKNGFLGIKCENSYVGPLDPDPETGKLRSTKADAAAHGFGLEQIRRIAGKYQSLLDVSYTEAVFTVQAALKLPDGP